jgi:hypothetical protein
MLHSRFRAAARLSVVAAVVGASLAGASGASAHTGGSNCFGELVEVGASYQGECTLPFQGFPIGVAGVYKAGDPARGSEIHVEVLAHAAFAPPRPMGVECEQLGGTSEARCTTEYNPASEPLTLVEPIPTQILYLTCAAHSHARYSRLLPPSGLFACWSTDEAREDLEADGVMEQIGY